MDRFTGLCEELCRCDPTVVTSWISKIPLSEWPQQRRVDEQLRPAMVTHQDWHGFATITNFLVWKVLSTIPDWRELRSTHRMLSVVMPRHSIESHRDQQVDEWRARIHVPLTTNLAAVYVAGDIEFNMQVGKAYLINTYAEHETWNLGPTPRIHLMFDVESIRSE